MMADPIFLLSMVASIGLCAVAINGLKHDAGFGPHQWFALTAALLAAEHVLSGLVATALIPEHMQRGLAVRGVVAAFIPAAMLTMGLAYGRINARETIRAWRWPVGIAVLTPLLVLMLSSGSIAGAVHPVDRVYWTVSIRSAGLALVAIEIIALVLAALHLNHTLHTAAGVIRWRIKYFIAGLMAIALARMYAGTVTLLTQSFIPLILPLQSVVMLVATALMFASLRRSRTWRAGWQVPVRIAVNAVVIVLAGILLFSLGLLAQSFATTSDQGAAMVWSLILLGGLCACGLLVLSEKIRLVIHRGINRYWRRPAHDYRALWLNFAERTSKPASADEIARAVCDVIYRTFAALSVHIWLEDEQQQLRLAASTAGRASGKAELPRRVFTPEEWKALRAFNYPVNIDMIPHAWAATFRASQSNVFDGGGPCYAIVLQHDGGVPGIILVGDRVNGAPMTEEDLELLHVLGNQTALRLCALRLESRRIVEEQAAAIQMMSAFLAHDLKNTALGLSLLVQNIPAHGHDGAFRRDALESMSTMVHRLNHMATRLTQLRQRIHVKPRPVEFRSWFAGMLSGLSSQHPGLLRWSDAPARAIHIDPEQMQGAVANLVINAREASPPDAPVEVTATCDDCAAVIHVRDQGAGMSEEFISGKLFQPFQTTKKNGMGIGLFHARMIVEAHGGRIDVKSRPNQGTLFQVTIPVGA